jgi:thioredoxin reductase (NADPH)
MEYDAIILGAGPAGLTAGIYMSRAHKKVVILDSGTIGGQVILSHKVANYPGVEEILGYQLARQMKKQAKSFGCFISSSVEIEDVSLEAETKEVHIRGGEVYRAPVLIIATGGTPRKLGIQGELDYQGRGISYCATCDGDFFTDQDIMVVGGGNSALEEAVTLTEYASSVTIVHQFDHFQAYPYAVEEARSNDKISFIMESEVVDFSGNEGVTGVTVRNRRTGDESILDVTGVFVFIGYVPNSTLFRDELELTEGGEIITDDQMRTGVAGVLAAGDVRQKRFRQITTAVSDGTIAALSALEYLKDRV